MSERLTPEQRARWRKLILEAERGQISMKTTPTREAKQNDWQERALKAEARCEQLEADKKRLDWLQAQIDPEKQFANGGFVVQTLEIRENATLRAAIDAAASKPEAAGE